MLMMFGIAVVVLRLAVALSKAGSSEAAAHTTTFALPSKTRRGKLHWGFHNFSISSVEHHRSEKSF